MSRDSQFLGQVLVYTGTPATVYLHDAAWEILEMAQEEYERRQPAEE